MSAIDRYYQLIQNEKILLTYKGSMDGETISFLVKLVEKSITEAGEKLAIRKKIVNILVESLQNILNYFAEESLDKSLENESFVIVTCTKQDYEITVGNYLSTQRMKTLKKRIDNVNMMSQEDLQKVYLDILENPKVSMSRGAGLGLIDMARRTQNKISYSFSPYDNDYVLFMMGMVINRVKDTVTI
jgi:Family of unknown function (DUF6272)